MAENKNEGIVEHIITIIVKATGCMSAFFLFFLMALIFFDVFCRYFFNSPILGGTELVEFLMALTISLSFAYGQYLKRHVFVELFYQYVKGRPKAVVDIIINLLCFAMYLLISNAAFEQSQYLRTVGMTSQVLLIPAWPFRLVLAFGALVYCIALIQDIIGAVRRLIHGDKATDCA